jgi:membrane-associated protease RseP (regulator of RpoE activity)
MSNHTAVESAASSAEAKTEPAAEPKTIDAESIAAGRSSRDDHLRSFPPAIYKPSVQSRFILLAAAVAFAAAFGGLLGSVSTYSLASPKTDPAEPTHKLQAALTQVTKDVAALKTSIEASSRATATQVSKINERFDRAERAQAEPAAKIAALTETVTRLEKRITANADAAREVTGSVPDRTATTAVVKDQSKPAIVEGWVLRDIYRGRALVESRSGLYEVRPGGNLPGIGKVETITQQNGRWVVVTPKGLIVSMR